MGETIHPVARLPAEWRAALARRGEPSYRADQIFRWIHRDGVMQPARMTNLPKTLRAALAAEGLAEPLQVIEQHRSADGARKLLVELGDQALVETVLLPQTGTLTERDADLGAATATDDDRIGRSARDGAAASLPRRVRVTQCISTQVGCAMGCVLCASGEAGLVRHLGAEEMVGQVAAGRAALEDHEALHNVLLMGMGEPLHNYRATKRALGLLTHPAGLGLSPRRITVSTCGLTPKIRQLADDFGGRVGLAVSIHGPDDETRSALCPVGQRHRLAELMGALRRYTAAARRPVTIEYTLVTGHNDAPQHARQLAALLANVPAKVNLIPLNVIDSSALRPPDQERVDAFRQVLLDRGLLCFVRQRRGDDVAAACGQLARRRPPATT